MAGSIVSNGKDTLVATAQFKSGFLDLSINELPSIPALIADAIRVIDDPSASGVDIEGVIMRDQALAVRVLRVVNSAAYGFNRRIESVREAVVMLGNRKIRNLAGSMVAASLYAKPLSGLVDPLGLWSHSVATSAWACEIIAYKRIWHAQSGVMAALLHDIGLVVLAQYAPARLQEVLETSQRQQRHHVLVEEELLGTTHARVGATLCAKWMLPVGLTQLINAHHTLHTPTDDALAVLMLADWLAHAGGHKALSWSVQPEIPCDLMASIGITAGDLEGLRQKSDRVDSRVASMLDAVKATSS